MTFDEYQERVRAKQLPLVDYHVIGLVCEVGAIAVLAQRRMRDDEWPLTEVLAKLSGALCRLSNLASDCGLSLEEVAKGGVR